MFAPAATPKDVLATLFKAIGEALKVPQLQEAFASSSSVSSQATPWMKHRRGSTAKSSRGKITSEIKIDLGQ
jgi:hypothetical protein